MSIDRGYGFEERLLQGLRQIVTDRSELLAASCAEPAAGRQRRSKRKFALAAAGVAAALAVAVATPLSSDGSSSTAYALSTHDDGTISVEIYGIHNQAEADTLERELEAAGVPDAEVYYIPSHKVCREDTPNHEVTEKWRAEFTIDPADLQGGILIVEYYIDETSGQGLIAKSWVEGRVARGPTQLDAGNLPPCALPGIGADSS